MRDLLLRLLGVDPGRIPPDAHTAFHFAHAPKSWMVFLYLLVAAGLVAAAVWVYRRDAAELPRARRATLLALRVSTLALLLLILLGPTLSVTRYQTLEPAVPLLLDSSLSMEVRDHYQDEARSRRVAELARSGRDAEPPTRAQLVDALLAPEQGLLAGLAAKGQLMPFALSDQARALAATDEPLPAKPGETSSATAPRLQPLAPGGQSTDLARGLREALAATAGRPVAGLVLVSDGQSTAGESPLAIAEQAARQGARIYAIGIGESREPRNWRVAETWAPERVHREDPFQVQARVEASGIAGGSVKVELVERRGSASGEEDGGRVVGSREVPLPAGGGSAQVQFEHKPQSAGEFVYTVRVVPAAPEQFAADNAKSVAVRVLDEQARVLLVSGGPMWEYRMVKTLLMRDRTIDVSCWLQSMDQSMRQEGDTVIERLPMTPEELFKFDCILMFDPDPAAFDEAWVSLLKRYLGEHGGGLLWMAGPKYTPLWMRRAGTLGVAEVLPVELDPSGAFGAENVKLAYTQAWPMKLTPDATDHPMFRLHQDPQINRQLCEALPGVFWSYPVRTAKPAARVLVEHGDPRLRGAQGGRPLLVVGQYGPGRTCFLGFEGTWRWRRVGEGVFDQWWIQAVRHLMEGRSAGARSRGRLGTDRDVYALGDRVAISARLFDRSFQPLTAEAATARLVGPGGRAVSVELKPGDQPAAFAGTAVAAELGLNRLEIELPGEAGAKPVVLSKHLTVEVPRVEFSDTRLNRALLQALCERSGGRYVEIEDAASLPAALPDRRETAAIPSRPIELWDTARVLLLLAALMCGEWLLRRRSRLL